MEQKYINRFWGRVHVQKKEKCWEWQAGTHEGYGLFYDGTKQESSHRVAYALSFGEIPKGLCACHSCDNKLCCNPNHLWVGTRRANNLDRDRKGRQITHTGEEHGMAKLKDEQVLEIRALYATGDYTYSKIAKRFNVRIPTVGNIVSGANWKHLPNNNSRYRQGKKLDKITAEMIRELYKTGKYTHSRLGKQFGVSKTMAGLIIRKRFWK